MWIPVEFAPSMPRVTLMVVMMDLQGREEPGIKAAAAGAAANGKEQDRCVR